MKDLRAEERLRQIRILESRIRYREDRLKELRYAAAGLRAISYDTVRVQSSPEDMMADRVSAVTEEEARLLEDIRTLTAERENCIKLIERIGDAAQEDVMRKFYVQGESITDISLDMNYSIQNIYALRKKGIERLNALLEAKARQDPDTDARPHE